MKRIEFREMLDDVLSQIKLLEDVKGDIYSDESDRLVQFKDIGFLAGLPPEQVCLVLWAKHITTIRYMIERMVDGNLPSEELVREATGDATLYPILMRGLLLDRQYVLPKHDGR